MRRRTLIRKEQGGAETDTAPFLLLRRAMSQDLNNEDTVERLADLAMHHADVLRAPRTITAEAWCWLAVHGAACLAMRHPGFTGPSRALVADFVWTLGRRLVEWGVLTEADLEAVAITEAEESPHGE